MEYITKKDLIDCSTPMSFAFHYAAWNVKQYGKAHQIVFFQSGEKNRKNEKSERLFNEYAL